MGLCPSKQGALVRSLVKELRFYTCTVQPKKRERDKKIKRSNMRWYKCYSSMHKVCREGVCAGWGWNLPRCGGRGSTQERDLSCTHRHTRISGFTTAASTSDTSRTQELKNFLCFRIFFNLKRKKIKEKPTSNFRVADRAHSSSKKSQHYYLNKAHGWDSRER